VTTAPRLRQSVRALILDPQDHVLLVRSHWEPAPAMSPAELVAEHVHEIRWWSPEELARQDAVFAPRAMPSLIDRLGREGVPEAPLLFSGF